MNFILLNYKEIFAFIATSFIFVSSIPYIKDSLIGKTKPHAYSWMLWSLVSSVVFMIQLIDGGGIGSLVTLAGSCVTIIIFIITVAKNGFVNITKSDSILIYSAIIALAFWPFTKNSTISVSLLTAIGLIALLPTIRKSLENPYEETLSSWFLYGVRFVFAIFALQKYDYITIIYPISWAIGNLGVAFVLLARRIQLETNNNELKILLSHQ